MMDVEGGKELERELNQTRNRLRAAQAASGGLPSEHAAAHHPQLQAVQPSCRGIEDQGPAARARDRVGSAAGHADDAPLFGFNFGGGGEEGVAGAPATSSSPGSRGARYRARRSGAARESQGGSSTRSRCC